VVPSSCAPDRELRDLKLMSISQLDELVTWFGLPDAD
jgi:hypothetical protein